MNVKIPPYKKKTFIFSTEYQTRKWIIILTLSNKKTMNWYGNLYDSMYIENVYIVGYRRKTRNSGFAFTSPQTLLSACHFFCVLSLFYQFGRSCSLRTRAQCFFFFFFFICLLCGNMFLLLLQNAQRSLTLAFAFSVFFTHIHISDVYSNVLLSKEMGVRKPKGKS